LAQARARLQARSADRARPDARASGGCPPARTAGGVAVHPRPVAPLALVAPRVQSVGLAGSGVGAGEAAAAHRPRSGASPGVTPLWTRSGSIPQCFGPSFGSEPIPPSLAQTGVRSVAARQSREAIHLIDGGCDKAPSQRSMDFAAPLWLSCNKFAADRARKDS